MNTVSDSLQLLNRSAHRWPSILFGLPFLCGGVFLAGAWLGQWPLYGKANAPLWVIGFIGVAFALAGFLLMSAGLRGWYLLWRGAKADPVWLGDYPWTSTGVAYNPYPGVMKYFVGAFFLFVFLAPFNWWAFFSGENVWMLKGIVGLFDLIAVLALLHALYGFAQAAKFGHSFLYFDQFPFVPGAPMSFSLQAPVLKRFHVTLRYLCEQFVHSGSGKNRSVSLQATELYREEQSVSGSAGRGLLKFQFSWPDEDGAEDWVNNFTPDPAIFYWELTVSAEDAGVDYRAAFPVPVYSARRSEVVRGRPPQVRSARRRIPFAFELGVPLALIAAWFLFGAMAPELQKQVRAPADKVWNRVQGAWTFRAEKPLRGSAMAVSFDDSGRGWLLTKYGLLREGEQGDQILMSAKEFRNRFGRHPAFSALYVERPDLAWVGSWKGDLFRIEGDSWQRVLQAGAPVSGRILKILRIGSELWLATSRGMWRQDGATGSFSPVSIERGKVNALLVLENGDVIAGVGKALYQRVSGGWVRILTAESEVLALGEWQGDLLVGTQRGLYRAGSGGHLYPFGADEFWVRDLAVVEDLLLAATWKNGLRLQGVDQAWRALTDAQGLPDNVIGDIAVSTDGRVWMALYKAGLVKTTLQQVLRHAR